MKILEIDDYPVEPGVEWRFVAEQPGYYVSSDGRLRHGRKLIRGALHPDGYRHVHTTHGMFKLHRLIAQAFHGSPQPGQVVCHWNDEKEDNRAVNLRWGSRSDNGVDRTRNGRDANANQTHCIRGHIFDAENTYWHPRKNRKPMRACRTCRRERKRARRHLELTA